MQEGRSFRCTSCIYMVKCKLREWTRWREAYIACEKGGLTPIAAAVAAGTLPAADGTAALRKRYCERFVRTVLDADETLRSFFGNGQDALVATFGSQTLNANFAFFDTTTGTQHHSSPTIS